VRDPVVVAGPARFLSLATIRRCHIDIDNVEGEAGRLQARSSTSTARSFAQADAMRKRPSSFDGPSARGGDDPGPRRRANRKPSLDLRFTGRLDVMRISARDHAGRARSLRRTITACRSASETISSGLLAHFIPARDRSRLSASPFGASTRPPSAILGALSLWLFPEQTVSRAMPCSTQCLASIEHLAIDPSRRTHPAIDRPGDGPPGIPRRFRPMEGWRPTTRSLVERFRVDFLTRARERSFAVPQQGFNQAARPAAQRSRQRRRSWRGRRRAASPMRSMSLPRNGRPSSAICVICRHQACRLQDAARPGADRRRARHAGRPGAGGQDIRRRASKPCTASMTAAIPGSTMVRACATAPGCSLCSPRPIWRREKSPTMRSAMPRRWSSWRATSAPTQAPRKTTGWCWRLKLWRNIRRRASSRSTAKPERRDLSQMERFRPRRHTGDDRQYRRDARHGRHHHFGQSGGGARAGGRAGLRVGAHLLQTGAERIRGQERHAERSLRHRAEK